MDVLEFEKMMDRYGELYARFALQLQPGEKVFVHADQGAMPLIRAFVKHALKAGAYPTVHIETPEIQKLKEQEGSLEQLRQTNEIMEFLIGNFDARFKIFYSENPFPDSNPLADDKRAAVREANADWYSKMLAAQARKKHPLKWTCGNYPCQAYAIRRGVSLHDYQEMVFKAAHCNKRDPVAANEAQEKRMLALADRLKGCERIRVVSPGTDLSMRCKGRSWARNFDRANIPGSETATSPEENSAEGQIYFSWPQKNYGGIRLEFKKGKCVKATCDTGDEQELNRILDQDKGARYVGEFAFGLNNAIKVPCGDTLFDEKIGGSIHIAVGASYQELGGRNKSNLHWDLVCNTRDEGEVWIDGELVLKNGKLIGIDTKK